MKFESSQSAMTRVAIAVPQEWQVRVNELFDVDYSLDANSPMRGDALVVIEKKLEDGGLVVIEVSNTSGRGFSVTVYRRARKRNVLTETVDGGAATDVASVVRLLETFAAAY